MSVFMKKLFMISILVFVLISISVPTSLHQILVEGTETVSSPVSRKHQTSWNYLNMWTDNDYLADVLIADVYPGHAGNEIITTSDNGYATMTFGNGESWKSTRIFKDTFRLRCIDIGDIYPQHPGNELVVSGSTGFVHMLYYDESEKGWVSELLFEDYDFVHDVAVGDIDPLHPGDEIVCVGESRRVSYIFYDQDTGNWSHEIIWMDRDLTSVIVVGEVLHDVQGEEIVVTGNTHNVTLISGAPGTWSVEHVWFDGTFIRDLEVGELDGNSSSGEILVAGFSKRVTMLSINSTDEWEPTVLWNPDSTVNDMMVVDFSGENDGTEVIAVSGAGDLVLLQRNGTEWNTESLFAMKYSPTKLAYGDYDGFHAGDEFAVLEFKARLSNLALEAFDFTLLSPQDSLFVVPGETIIIDLLVIENGGFDELVFLNVEDITFGSTSYMECVDFEFEVSSLRPTSFMEVALNISDSTPVPSLEVTFIGASQTSKHFFNLTLYILNADELPNGYKSNSLNLNLEPRLAYIVADYTTNILVNLDGYYLYSNDNESPLVIDLSYIGKIDPTFSIENSPLGITIQPDFKSLIDRTFSKYLLTLRADTNVPVGEYFIFIKSIITVNDAEDNSFKFERVRVMQLVVEQVGTPDFYFELAPEHDINLLNGTGFTWTVSLNAISGFDLEVNLEVEKIDSVYDTYIFGPPIIMTTPLGNSTVELSGNSLTTTNTVDMTLKAGEFGALDKIYLIMKASYKGRFKFDIIEINVVRNTTKLEISTIPEIVKTYTNQETMVNISITPVERYEGKVELRFLDKDDGNKEWGIYRTYVNVEGISLISKIFNISRAGTYNLTVVAIIKDDVVASTDFTIEVENPTKPDDGENGGTGGTGDDNGKGSFLTQNSLLLMGILIIILILILIGANTLVERRKRKKKKKEEEKREGEKKEKKSEGASTMKRPRPPVKRQSRLSVNAEPMHKIEAGKIEHVHPKNKREYKMGDKIFKPGGKHESESLMEGEERVK